MPEKPDTTDDPQRADDPDVADVTPHDQDDEHQQKRAARRAATDETGRSDPVDRDDTPPAAVVEAAERLTHRAREAVDDAEAAAYRTDRDERLAAHGYTARVREDETRDVLVLYPGEWVEDGQIHPERVDDIDRGIEIPLSGPGAADDWEVVDGHNRELVAAVRAEHGELHGANAEALADFMGNHYSKPIESATKGELREFLDHYYPRNAWPTDEQSAVVEKSVRLVFDAADELCPLD